MVARIQLESGIGKIWAEIHHDETVVFEDRFEEAMQYDQAMAEFGEGRSVLMAFAQAWEKSPWNAISEYLIGQRELCRYCTDIVEHVLVLGFINPDFSIHISLIKEAIARIRMREESGVLPAQHKMLMESISRDLSERGLTEADRKYIVLPMSSSRYVIDATIHMIKADLRGYDAWYSFRRDVGSVSEQAVCAAVWGLSGPFEVRAQARKAEQDWQFRRLVDVVAAIHADEPWPPLEVTQ